MHPVSPSVLFAKRMLSERDLSVTAFVAVDLEATGHRPGQDSILEVGAARIEAGRVVDSFSSLVAPDSPIPRQISELTGITSEMVERAPHSDSVFEDFTEFAADAVLIAHDHRFDMGFLDFESERSYGRPFPRPVIDTLALARRLRPGFERYNLSSLADRFGVDASPNHRAHADALATGQIFVEMIPELIEMGLRTVGDVDRYCGMEHLLALASKLTLTTELPASPGVYAFRDEAGSVFHIGRAQDLRQRVRGYFYAPARSRRSSLAERVHGIRHVACASMLDAILVEYRLLERHADAARGSGGRSVRRPAYLVWDDRDGFPALRVRATPEDGTHSLGPYLGRRRLETLAEHLSEAYALRRCDRPLTDAATEACDLRDEGGCPAPCVGDVDRAAYRQRLATATAGAAGHDGDAKRRLQRALEDACSGEGDPSVRRRGLKSLERSVSSLRLLQEASSTPCAVLLEEVDGAVIVHLLRHGRRVWSYAADETVLEHGDAARALVAAVHGSEHVGRAKLPSDVIDVYLTSRYRDECGPVAIEASPEDDPILIAAEVVAAARAMSVSSGRRS